MWFVTIGLVVVVLGMSSAPAVAGCEAFATHKDVALDQFSGG